MKKTEYSIRVEKDFIREERYLGRKLTRKERLTIRWAEFKYWLTCLKVSFDMKVIRIKGNIRLHFHPINFLDLLPDNVNE